MKFLTSFITILYYWTCQLFKDTVFREDGDVMYVHWMEPTQFQSLWDITLSQLKIIHVCFICKGSVCPGQSTLSTSVIQTSRSVLY